MIKNPFCRDRALRQEIHRYRTELKNMRDCLLSAKGEFARCIPYEVEGNGEVYESVLPKLKEIRRIELHIFSIKARIGETRYERSFSEFFRHGYWCLRDKIKG